MGPTAGNRLVPPALTVACPQANHRLGFCPTCQPRGTRPCSGHPQAPGWARPLPGPPHGPRPQSEWEGCRLCSGASSGSPLTLQTQAAPPSRPLPDQSHTDFGPGRWGQHDTRVKGSGARPRGGLESPRHLGACSLSATCPPAPHGDSTQGGKARGHKRRSPMSSANTRRVAGPEAPCPPQGHRGRGRGGHALAGPRSHAETRGTAHVTGTWSQKTRGSHSAYSRACPWVTREGGPKAGPASLLTWWTAPTFRESRAVAGKNEGDG